MGEIRLQQRITDKAKRRSLEATDESLAFFKAGVHFFQIELKGDIFLIRAGLADTYLP